MSRLERLRPALVLAVTLGLAAPCAAAETPQTRPHDHSHGPTSTRSFEDVDRWTAVFDDPARAEWQKPHLIPAELGLEEGMVVADIGAGTGYFERHFASAVGAKGRVYAVDTEPGMVEHMRERAKREETPNVVPVLGAPGDPRLPDGGVDAIFICDTWHHIGDRVDYLKRLARALKPGGTVAVVDFKKEPIPVGPPMDHKLSRESVLEEFTEAGWVLSRESDLLPYQYFLIFRPQPVAD